MRVILLGILFLITSCKPIEPVPSSPTPLPSATPIILPSPSPSPVVVPTATPFPSPGSSTPKAITICYKPEENPPVYNKAINDAVGLYKAEHLEDFRNENGDLTDCILNPSKRTGFYYGVVKNLNDYGGVDAIVDDCGGTGVCGEIAVKGHGVKKGEGFSEQHQIMVSWGCIRSVSGGRYRGRCVPAWFDK